MIASSLGSRFRTLAATTGTTTPEQLARSAALLREWRTAVRCALAERHLVDVAFELAVVLGWPASTLAAVDVPVDVLECFPDWRGGSRVPFVRRAAGVRLAPQGAAVPLETIRLQLSPARGTIPYALLLLRHLLSRLDRTTRFVVVVEPGADIEALRQLVRRFHSTALARVHFVQMRCITVFAQDNARAARDTLGQPVLLIPRAFREGSARQEDELDPAEAERAFGVPVRRSRMYWEGGNIVHDDERCFVGADTIAENAARLGLTRGEVAALLEDEFGLPVTPLGRIDEVVFDPAADRPSSSGQAAFHIDLDVSLLGRFGRARRPRALVADAARGLDFVDAVLSTRRLVAGHFLPPRDIRRHLRAEYEAHATARHPRLLEYASALAEHGYRVVGVPDLRIDPKMDVFQRVNLDFGFCNVLPALRRNRPALFHFTSGVGPLDRDASRRMRFAGVEPVPVSTPDVASALMLLHGGLHCCCGSL
jgi:hypothetical protein